MPVREEQLDSHWTRFVKPYTGTFKIGRENSNLVDMGQKYQTLSMKIETHL
jgi:hypothetical protein